MPIKPVKIKFNSNYLIKVKNLINKETQNLLYMSYDIPENFNINSDKLDNELDKITFIHYYFSKKLSKETINIFRKLSDTKGLSNEEILKRSELLESLSLSVGDLVKYKLTQEQKNKIYDRIL